MIINLINDQAINFEDCELGKNNYVTIKWWKCYKKSTYLQVDTIAILRNNDFDTFLSGKDLGTSSRKFGLVEISDSPYFLGL